MNLCSRNHEEICFEGRDCPLCEAESRIEELEDALEELREKLKGAV